MLWRYRDEVAAALFLVLGQATVWTASPGGDTLLHGSRAWNAVVLAATALPLAWRRSAPAGALVAGSAAFCLTQAVALHGLPFYTGVVPLMVLAASAGWYARGPRGVLAIAFAIAGLLVLEWAEPTYRLLDRLPDIPWLLVPWGAMRALRARDDRVRRLAGELAVLEASHEAQRRQVVAAERARIARDLHDVVAHATSVMVIQVGAARMRHAAGEQDIAEQLAVAESTGRQAIAELRRLLDVLRTWPESGQADRPDGPEPPQPRLGELDGLVASYRAAGLRVDAECCVPDDVPLGVQVSAYRIVQEALTNSLRHGAGRPVTVRVARDETGVVLEVTDRGGATGDAAGAGLGGGQGLVGMAERARLLGGTVSAGPNLDGGWTVLATLPLAHDSRPVGQSPA